MVKLSITDDDAIDMSSLTGLPKAHAPVSAEPVAIALADIEPDPDQPRKEFDTALIETIAGQLTNPDIGQLESIYVRSSPSGDSKYMIVHGETRYRAAQLAGVETLNAIVIENGGFIRQLLSNETRGDLSLMDRAKAYSQLTREGYTQKAIAGLLGTTEMNISRYLHLLDMPELVERAFNDGKATTLRVLDDLRKLIDKHPKAHEAIEKFISDAETVTVGQIAELSKRLAKRKPKAKQKSGPMIDGKSFKVVGVDGDVMTVKKSGDKEATQYRLVPIDSPD